MKDETARNEPAIPSPAGQHRCICCGGVIDMPDHDLGLGLNLSLGLVSDECALICDSCTANLIAARPPQNRSCRIDAHIANARMPFTG
jgi:hypothetical protein